LLHRNTSDLSEQRYSATFAGDEFFLVDHQLKREGQAGQKVLPGVAYLEMARAALELAWHEGRESTVLELLNVVWAQPMVVSGTQEISIALWAMDSDKVDFKIYTQDFEEERVYCQGLAVWSQEGNPATLDVEQLKGEMRQGKLERDSVYSAWSRVGVIYGPRLQGITALHLGNNQVVAQLRLPDAAADKSGDYVLHPSLMDGALQAAIGLIGDLSEAASIPRVHLRWIDCALSRLAAGRWLPGCAMRRVVTGGQSSS